jgi:hypothetical protein
MKSYENTSWVWTRRALLLSGLTIGALEGCSAPAKEAVVTDKPPAGLDWGSGVPSFVSEVVGAAGYSGTDENTRAAAAEFSTAADLHAKVILRSCGPLSGVCHNKKEYPDLHTSYNFLAAIGAPCNVQPGTPESVFDRCERPGDRVAFDGGAEVEIGYIEYIPYADDDQEVEDESATRPGLHIHLADPVSGESGRDRTIRFVRTFVKDGNVEDISFASLRSRLFYFDEGRHVVADTRYNERAVNELLAVGIEQGDLNRNGILGARPDGDGNTRGPTQLIVRGSPETSYLVARMRGIMEGETVPGTRMPLANPPFSTPEMLALFCFIEGLPADGDINLDSPINYEACSYSDPALQDGLRIEGVGTGWKERIAPLLEANCGGCHSEERAEGELILVGKGAYDAIVSAPSYFDSELTLVVPGDLENSYLYKKLIGDPSIFGDPMPLDPLLGVRKLDDRELEDIRMWIESGALP